jgi:hypothetical protein
MRTAANELDRIRTELVNAIAVSGTMRQPARRRRSAWVIAGIAVALLALAGYTLASQVWVGNVDYQDAYRAAQRQLRLPPGMTWPKRTIPPDVKMSSNAGGSDAVTIAWSGWACYWTTAIQHHDHQAQAASATAMADLLKNNMIEAPANSSEDFFVPSDHPVAIWGHGGLRNLRHEYQAGLARNVKPLQLDCRANGPGQ